MLRFVQASWRVRHSNGQEECGQPRGASLRPLLPLMRRLSGARSNHNGYEQPTQAQVSVSGQCDGGNGEDNLERRSRFGQLQRLFPTHSGRPMALPASRIQIVATRVENYVL